MGRSVVGRAFHKLFVSLLLLLRFTVAHREKTKTVATLKKNQKKAEEKQIPTLQ